MNKVLLVVGEVSSTHIAAFTTAIRQRDDVSPLICFVPADLADLREVAANGMTKDEAYEARRDPRIIAEHVAKLDEHVTQRILPKGVQKADITHVLWSHKLEDQTGFRWLIPGEAAHCVLRMGDNREVWAETDSRIGAIDISSALYSVA